MTNPPDPVPVPRETLESWALDLECYGGEARVHAAIKALLAAPVAEKSWFESLFRTVEEYTGCGCYRCIKEADRRDILMSRMVVCPKCGNKRCPKAEDHRFVCTGSNVPNQVGELEPNPDPREP